jgi:hypothetical protein
MFFFSCKPSVGFLQQRTKYGWRKSSAAYARRINGKGGTIVTMSRVNSEKQSHNGRANSVQARNGQLYAKFTTAVHALKISVQHTKSPSCAKSQHRTVATGVFAMGWSVRACIKSEYAREYLVSGTVSRSRSIAHRIGKDYQLTIFKRQ